MKALLPWLVTGAVALGLVAARISKPKPRYLGDLAEVGDEVALPVERFQLPLPPFQLPAGVGQIVVKVSGAAQDTLSGLVTSYVTTVGQRVEAPAALTTAFGPQTVFRSAVTGVSRSGKSVTL